MAEILLRYRAPYDWPLMLTHLRARAIDGVEWFEGDAYARTITVGRKRGIVEVRYAPKALVATLRFGGACSEPAIAERLALLFDVDANITTIGAHLSRDPLLAPLVAARPGLRVAGSWDSFELAVRAVLGQQISVERARKLAGSLVRLCGTAMRGGRFAFPSAADVARADLGPLGMPTARKAALHAIANAAITDPHVFDASDTIEQTVTRLRAIRGVGDWTAHYIALRAARDADAFPSTDVGLLRATALSPADLVLRAERWRPWRAYAAQHLWMSLLSAHTPARARRAPA